MRIRKDVKNGDWVWERRGWIIPLISDEAIGHMFGRYKEGSDMRGVTWIGIVESKGNL